MPLLPEAVTVGAHTRATSLEPIERAISIALAPLDHADAIGWGDALTTAMCALTNANAGAFLLPGMPTRWRAVARDATSGESVGVCGSHEELTERLYRQIEGDLVLWARDDLATDSPAIATSFSSSTTIGLRVRAASGAVASVCVYRDGDDETSTEYLIGALRAIAPAFRAGVSTWMAATICRSDITRMLDSLADPALLFDAAGEVTHTNTAMLRLVASPDTSRLQHEAQEIAWSLGAVARRRVSATAASTRSAPRANTDANPQAIRSVRIGATVFRLRGALLGEHLLGTDRAVLVTITAAAAEPLTDDALQASYGLTLREIQVARLLAEGLSNSEISARLGVKFFTARNHVERTLAKLGVASRHRVGPLLRNESTPDAESGRASAA